MKLTSRAVNLAWAGKLPTDDLIDEVVFLERVGEALDILDPKMMGRVAVPVALNLTQRVWTPL